ncbi:MAG: apolipoprotein N-acyltransferase [Puniceicoccaceae bacterium 5H]|nr:MAG: apolipoprotein N-acyltransferase [Puniceicoccaceae bacterium 5H]
MSLNAKVWKAFWPWLAGLSTPLLWVLAFPPVGFDELAYVYLVPLVLWAFTRPAGKAYGWITYGGAFLAWVILLSWLRHFTSHLDAPAWQRVGGAWLAFVSLSAFLALFFWAWARALRWMLAWSQDRPWYERLLAFAALAGFWVVLEWVRGWIFSGFPWLPLAASQWRNPLVLQILPVTGYYGLSFLLVFFNLAVAAYLRQMVLQLRQKLRWQQRISIEFYTALGLLALSIVQGFGQRNSARQEERLGDVAFVQPYIKPQQRWDESQDRKTLETMAHLTRLAGMLQPDLILWPEAPTPLFFKAQPTSDRWAAMLTQEVGAPILLGGMVAERRDTDDGPAYDSYNAVLLATPDAGVKTDFYYAKRHLVPFGEYTPFASLLPAVVPTGFQAGDHPAVLHVPLKTRSVAIGPLVCYEDVFPDLAREQVREGAEVLFVANNNSWYGQEGSGVQHASHAVLRAVETRRPVMRCGNGGWSGWIDEHGQIRHELRDVHGHGIYFEGVQNSIVTRDPRFQGYLTPFVRYGPWFVYVCMALTAVGAFFRLRKRAQNISIASVQLSQNRVIVRR